MFAGVDAENALALQVPLLMKVLWLDSGEVESLQRSMCLISASLMRLWTPVGGGGDRAVFPTGIDRCLFVFARP